MIIKTRSDAGFFVDLNSIRDSVYINYVSQFKIELMEKVQERKNRLSEIFTKVLEEKQVTQEELSQRTGIPLSEINGIMSGDKSFDIEKFVDAVEPISIALDVDVDRLILKDLIENPHPDPEAQKRFEERLLPHFKEIYKIFYGDDETVASENN